MPDTSAICNLLAWSNQQLAHSPSAAVDSRVLLCHCSGLTPAYLMTWPEKQVPSSVEQAFIALVEKRKLGHPVAYLIGYRDFWTLRLKVAPDTLIPRPETELLVETSLSLSLPESADVLDLGTGTGAVALALAAERPNWSITAVDSQMGAVKLAQQNAALHNLTNVSIYQSDWFQQIDSKKFDLIVSNPPYVESNSVYLKQGDVRFEPLSALTSGKSGLDDIELICQRASDYLVPGASLIFEHGYNQAEKVTQLLHRYGFEQCRTIADLNGLARITGGILP